MRVVRSLVWSVRQLVRTMYSLYRSWLSREPPPSSLALGLAVPPCRDPIRDPLRDPLSLPDVVVAVGENPGVGGPGTHQFAAHRSVLSANSGYFKAALGGPGLEAPPCACVTVNGVSPEAFAPLLAFMYTGYLDIGRDNIYAVLLATHYLHMPRALELCWNFLRAHPPAAPLEPPSTPILVKPIPGLPWRPSPGHPPGPPQLPQPPAANMVLSLAEHSPFRAPFATSSPPPAADSTVPSLTAATAPQRETSTKSQPRQTVAKDSQSSSSPATSPGRDPGLAVASAPEPVASSSAVTKSAPLASSSTASGSSSGKVVIDVACCDGPVRFHRVLNASYGSEDAVEMDESATDENQLHDRMHVPGAAQLRRARKLAEEGADQGGIEEPSQGANEYTCLYCNHTFKSHYCYQKHARRHLNPLTPKQGTVAPSGATPAASGRSTMPSAARTPARPLDMNVQYYPCKTCGSKFPSYYFVHKHRKLCHSAEEEAGSSKKADD